MSYIKGGQPRYPFITNNNNSLNQAAQRQSTQNTLLTSHTQTVNNQRLNQQNQQVQATRPQAVTKYSTETEKIDALKQNVIPADLTKSQKNTLHNISAFVKLVSSDQFKGMLKRNPPLQNENLDLNSTLFFNDPYVGEEDSVFERTENYFTMKDLVHILVMKGICLQGQEEEFLDILMELSISDNGFEQENNLDDFSPPVHRFLSEMDIERQPSMLKKLAQLLNNLQHSQHTVSGEQKRQVFSVLEDAEDKDEIRGLEFDYAKISEVL